MRISHSFQTLLTTTLLFASGAVCAQTVGGDWKLYGYVELKGTSGFSDCFFDSTGAINTSDRHVRVWTKCLPDKPLSELKPSDYDGKLLQSVAQKQSRHYLPPYATVRNVTEKDLLSIIIHEEAANLDYIHAQVRIFYDLDCSGQMERELSTNYELNGLSASTNNPTDWQQVAPETNAANLLRLACPKP